MKIKNWHKTEMNPRKTVWKHDTGIYIMMENLGPEYQLTLFDSAGREQYRFSHPNLVIVQRQCSKWQRDYNKYLSKKVNNPNKT